MVPSPNFPFQRPEANHLKSQPDPMAISGLLREGATRLGALRLVNDLNLQNSDERNQMRSDFPSVLLIDSYISRQFPMFRLKYGSCSLSVDAELIQEN